MLQLGQSCQSSVNGTYSAPAAGGSRGDGGGGRGGGGASGVGGRAGAGAVARPTIPQKVASAKSVLPPKGTSAAKYGNKAGGNGSTTSTRTEPEKKEQPKGKQGHLPPMFAAVPLAQLDAGQQLRIARDGSAAEKMALKIWYCGSENCKHIVAKPPPTSDLLCCPVCQRWYCAACGSTNSDLAEQCTALHPIGKFSLLRTLLWRATPLPQRDSPATLAACSPRRCGKLATHL